MKILGLEIRTVKTSGSGQPSSTTDASCSPRIRGGLRQGKASAEDYDAAYVERALASGKALEPGDASYTQDRFRMHFRLERVLYEYTGQVQRSPMS